MAFLSFNANAQEHAGGNHAALIIEGLRASVSGKNLVINWKANDVKENEYWEVQASADGKNYSTVGMVWGADPKMENGNYSFKNRTTSIKPGMKFYRVLNIQSESTAFASNSVSVSK